MLILWAAKLKARRPRATDGWGEVGVGELGQGRDLAFEPQQERPVVRELPDGDLMATGQPARRSHASSILVVSPVPMGRTIW